MLTELQFPYTGPYGLATSGKKSKGPTAEALKRALSRMGLIDWTDFDQHYNARLEAAFDKIDPGKNGYGPGRWTLVRGLKVPANLAHAGEYALDGYARTIVQDEAGVQANSTDEAKVQAAIAEFGYRAIANEPNIHYVQARPVNLSAGPGGTYAVDCSGTVLQAFHYAMEKTGIKVFDPAKQGWSGYGNTDEYEDDWPKVGAPYRIGDLAHFKDERHVIFCIKGGDYKTAEWCSHGREAGPELIRLATYSRYPEEFMFVVRPELTT